MRLSLRLANSHIPRQAFGKLKPSLRLRPPLAVGVFMPAKGCVLF